MSAIALPSGYDRLLDAFRRLVGAEVAPLRFLGTYGYVVTATDGETIDGTPTDPTQHLPPAKGWPMRSCVCGATATPTVGRRCRVTFENGDPTLPICVGCDGPPQKSTLDATADVKIGPSASTCEILGGTTPAVKLGDTVQSFVTGGLTILAGQLVVTGVAPGTLTITGGLLTVQGLQPISGTVTTGSSKLSVPGA